MKFAPPPAALIVFDRHLRGRYTPMFIFRLRNEQRENRSGNDDHPARNGLIAHDQARMGSIA
jgi:hypothetical protein